MSEHKDRSFKTGELIQNKVVKGEKMQPKSASKSKMESGSMKFRKNSGNSINFYSPYLAKWVIWAN